MKTLENIQDLKKLLLNPYHKETEILHQLEILNLLEQLKNN